MESNRSIIELEGIKCLSRRHLLWKKRRMWTICHLQLMVNAMMTQTLEYIDPKTPSHVRGRLEEQCVANKEGRDD